MSVADSARLRQASVEDAAALARVYVETARAQYGSIVTARLLTGLSASHLARRWEWLLTNRRWVRSAYLVEEPRGRVVGFAAAGPSRISRLKNAGEVFAIYVSPDRQRQELGRLLFARTLKSLRAEGVDSIVARVFAANPARGFFEALGGTWMASSASSPSRPPKVTYVWNL